MKNNAEIQAELVELEKEINAKLAAFKAKYDLEGLVFYMNEDDGESIRLAINEN